jgi:hypothetical protein
MVVAMRMMRAATELHERNLNVCAAVRQLKAQLVSCDR